MGRSNQKAAVGQATDYLGLHRKMLAPATLPPFHIHAEPTRSEDYDGILLSAGKPVYVSTLQQLADHGIDVVYVAPEQREACLDYIEQNMDALLRAGPPADYMFPWLHAIACRAMQGLLEAPKSYPDYEHVRALVGALSRTMSGGPAPLRSVLQHNQNDYRTHVHCVNVCALLADFGQQLLGVSDPGLQLQLGIGGALHDLGKSVIDSRILDKPGRLTEDEFGKIRRHPRYGLSIAHPYLRDAPIACRVIAQHHEDVSGGGYPDGRAGESINIFARAARIADVFDALTSHRPYADAMSEYEALNVMVNDMRDRFDTGLLRKFISYLGDVSGADAPVRVHDSMLDIPSAQEETEATMEDSRAEETTRLLPATSDTSVPGSTPEPESAPAAPEQVEEPIPVARPVRAESEHVAAAVDTLDERLRTIDALIDRWDGPAGVMSGLLHAVQNAVANTVASRPAPQPTTSGEPAAEPARTLSEVDRLRRLFPVIWELDLWRYRMNRHLQDGADELAADVLSFASSIRGMLVDFLAENRIEVIEEGSGAEGIAVLAKSGSPGAEDTGRTGYAQRVGFARRTPGAVQILVPPRMVLCPDMRKAG